MRAPLFALSLLGCVSPGPTSSTTDRPDQWMPTTPTDRAPTPTATSADTGSTKTDTKTKTGIPGTPGLLVPDTQGIRVLDLDGTQRRSFTWPELTEGPCPCTAEGGSADRDGLLLSFVTDPGGIGAGDIIRVGADGTLDFRVASFDFPHDAIRDPADDSIMVVETFGSQVRWIAGDGASNKAIRTLGSGTADFVPGPNGAERFDHEGRSYLLLSHLGDLGQGAKTGGGRITLWDITTAGSPTHVWSFPDASSLDWPHAPILREADGSWWLLWAHTLGGANQEGTVGVAQTSSPLIQPTYLADLVPTEGPLQFMRGVELHEGTLYVTDTPSGQIFTADWVAPPTPSTEPAYVDLVNQQLLVSELERPFEAWLWLDPLK